MLKSQTEEAAVGKIMIWGFVKEEGRGLRVKVYVYADDTQVRSLNTDEKGRFEVDLPYDAYYKFEFAKRNYVQKMIEIDATEVPRDHQRFGHEWGGWQVELLRKVPGLDTSIYEFPVAKATYEEDEANFGFDYSYMNAKEKEFKEAEKEQKRLIKEYEKKQKEDAELYAELLDKANTAYDANELEGALDAYEKVLEIKSNEALALERRDEIKLTLETQANYAKFKGEAKAKEAGGELELAIEFWRKAKPLKPESPEAQTEIERITKILDDKKAELLAEEQQAEKERMLAAEAVRAEERAAAEQKKEEERLKKEEERKAQEAAEEARLKREKEEADRLLAERREAEMKEAEAKRAALSEEGLTAQEILDQMDKHSDEFVMKIASLYAEGVTEEVEKFKNRTVYKRIVVKGNRGHLYEKVVYNYGGKFYFKDGDSVDQFIWDKETVLNRGQD